MVVGCYLRKAVSFTDICRQEQNILTKNCRLCLKVWESRALPSRHIGFLQSMASSRVLAYFWMFFGFSSHVSLIYLNSLKFIGSVYLPPLPTSNAIPLDSVSLLLRSSPALALPRDS